MFEQISYIFIGFILFPILYSLLPFKTFRKKLTINNEKMVFMTDFIKKNMLKGFIETNETAWVNLLVQRIYIEAVQNYNFHMKMKNLLLKNFGPILKTGLIKDIKIRHLELGTEAPYIKSIKVLTKEELESLKEYAENDDGSDLKRLSEKLSKEITNFDIKSTISNNLNYLNGSSETVGFINKKTSKKKETIEFIDKNTSPEINSKISDKTLLETYKTLHFLVKTSYPGSIQVSLEIMLSSNVSVTSNIILKGFDGQAIFKMPSDTYNTRYEITFIGDPNFNVSVDSGIFTKTHKILFQRSLSSFLKKAIIYSLKKFTVYPNWSTYLHFFVPNKEITHKIQQITIPKILESENIADKIMLCMDSDFKIDFRKETITFKSFNSKINGLMDLKCSSFEIPKFIEGIPKNFFLFDKLSVQESKLMNKFYDLSILEHVNSKFKDIRVKYQKKNYSIVILTFNDTEYEFIRIITGNSVIFQRNSEISPEFFCFRIKSLILDIFCCNLTKELNFTIKRIEKLKKKIFAEPLSLLGSNMLYKFLLKRKNNFIPKSTDKSEKEIFNIESELKNVFDTILDKKISKFISEKYEFKITNKELLNLLLDDSLRLKLFSESGQILNTVQEDKKIFAIIYEEIRSTNRFNEDIECNESIIYSYKQDNIIVDLNIEKNLCFVYKFKQIENTAELGLFTNAGKSVLKSNYFLAALNLKIGHQRFLKPINKLKSEVGLPNLVLEHKITDSALYFEFETDIEDDFKLKIINQKNLTVIFEISKIISNKKFQVLLPLKNLTYKIILQPKFNRNDCVYYKLQSINNTNDYYINGIIGLSLNESLSIEIKGMPTHVIFWEREIDRSLKTALQTDDTECAIDRCGLIRAENKTYKLIYKNLNRKKRDIKLFAGLTFKK